MYVHISTRVKGTTLNDIYRVWNCYLILSIDQFISYPQPRYACCSFNEELYQHHSDVMIVMTSEIDSPVTSFTIVYSTVYWGTDKENLKAPRHQPFGGNSPITGEFPTQRASNAENASIWWRQLDCPFTMARNILVKFEQQIRNTALITDHVLLFQTTNAGIRLRIMRKSA